MTESSLGGDGPGLVDRLLALALRNRLLVLIGVAIVGIVGFRSLAILPIDAVPDVTNVQVQILTQAPGLGPLEVERLVTTPIEASMGGLPRLTEMRSTSRFGLSAITLVFEDGTDLYRARQLVGEHLTEARDALPDGLAEPELGPPATGLGEIFQFEIVGDGVAKAFCFLATFHQLVQGQRGTQRKTCDTQDLKHGDYGFHSLLLFAFPVDPGLFCSPYLIESRKQASSHSKVSDRAAF